ncbi:aldo/keto reductase [Salinibius halmophilus]|uniref:aldo/keto reductase n=1 Tax=Salinibius halmophilus TaxID=1853216 RepID=UPI000E670B69|nr:aldo/keto reductase [Salinibius halmophilus]
MAHPFEQIDFFQGYWRTESWGMDAQALLAFTKQHMELGIYAVDHAWIYGARDSSCEALFGDAMALDPSIRQQLHIVSKCGIVPPSGNCDIAYYDSSREEILRSVEESLTRLKTDYIDTLLLHRPDLLLNPAEVAEVFEQLHAQGKVRYFGVSNYAPHEFDLLQQYVDQPLITNQVEINLGNMYALEDGTLAQAQTLQRRPMAWSCLMGGRLFNPESEQDHRIVAALHQVKEEVGANNIEQVAMSWVQAHPARPIPIIGSGKIERVRDAVESKNIKLSREQWYRLWGASKGHGVA